MSTVYATEPSPSGRLVLETTHGSLDVELFCRECPTSTKFLLQLALDGFYDNVVFHRILPDTLIQCGAVRWDGQVAQTATAPADDNNNNNNNNNNSSSSSLWKAYRKRHNASRALERQRFELHSRLRFVRRGMVALALPLEDASEGAAAASLQPQFFVTLQETPYLDGKHVIVGRVTGPTVFHALRIGKTQEGAVGDDATGSNLDNVNELPRITSVRIVDNPLHTDLCPTPDTDVPWKQQQKAAKTTKQKKKRKGKLDVNVLSFGDELVAGEEVAEKPAKKKKSMKSVHDVETNDKDNEQDTSLKQPSSRELTAETVGAAPDESNMSNDNEATTKETTKSNVSKKEDIESENKKKPKAKKPKPKKAAKLSGADLLQAMRTKSQFASAALRSNQTKQQNNKARDHKEDNEDDRDQATMSKLMAFQSRLGSGGGGEDSKGSSRNDSQDNSLAARMARKARQQQEQDMDSSSAHHDDTYHGQVLEDHRSQTDASWMSTHFQCRKHMDLIDSGMGGDGRRADEYEVVDDRGNDQQRSDHRDHRHRHREEHHRHHRRDRDREDRDRHHKDRRGHRGERR